MTKEIASGAINQPQTNTISSEEVLTKNICGQQKEEPLKSAENAIIGQPLTESLSDDFLIYGNLNRTVIDQCQKFQKMIKEMKVFSESLSPKTMFEISVDVINFESWLIGQKNKAESLYRIKLRDLSREMTASKAEMETEAGGEYIGYRYLKQIFELAEDVVMIVKKFKEDLEKEFNNQS